LGLDYVVIEGEQTSAVSAPAARRRKETKHVASTVTSVGLPRVELYATVAQAYRPLTYGELVPTSADGVVNGDLKEGNSLQFELGVRGKPLPYLTYDVSGFYYTFNDQVGEITGINSAGVSFTTTENVGDARFLGLEAATDWTFSPCSTGVRKARMANSISTGT
jgi:Fe(3+) dicitrate transport protein